MEFYHKLRRPTRTNANHLEVVRGDAPSALSTACTIVDIASANHRAALLRAKARYTDAQIVELESMFARRRAASLETFVMSELEQRRKMKQRARAIRPFLNGGAA